MYVLTHSFFSASMMPKVLLSSPFFRWDQWDTATSLYLSSRVLKITQCSLPAFYIVMKGPHWFSVNELTYILLQTDKIRRLTLQETWSQSMTFIIALCKRMRAGKYKRQTEFEWWRILYTMLRIPIKMFKQRNDMIKVVFYKISTRMDNGFVFP